MVSPFGAHWRVAELGAPPGGAVCLQNTVDLRREGPAWVSDLGGRGAGRAAEGLVVGEYVGQHMRVGLYRLLGSVSSLLGRPAQKWSERGEEAVSVRVDR